MVNMATSTLWLFFCERPTTSKLRALGRIRFTSPECLDDIAEGFIERKPLLLLLAGADVDLGDKLRNWAIAYCGLNCAKCDMYEAGHGNEKKRDEILAWLKEERNKILKPEQITCGGCRGPLGAHWSEDCKMMLCAKKKGVQYCFECADFPCSLLNAFSSDGASHHKRTVENMKKMKEIGLDAWTAEQETKGKCEFCP